MKGNEHNWTNYTPRNGNVESLLIKVYPLCGRLHRRLLCHDFISMTTSLVVFYKWTGVLDGLTLKEHKFK